MIIARMCQECIKQTQGDCVGRDTVTILAGYKPCKLYELDPQLISDQDIEPGDAPPSLKTKTPVMGKRLIPVNVLPTNKVKADNFERLAIKRLVKLLNDFRILGNLSSKQVYEFTQEQVDMMLSRIRNAADEFEKKFRK